MLQPWARDAWRLVRAQHGVVARAVGRGDLSRRGELMAAVLACGTSARLSHGSGAELWRICAKAPGPIDVTVASSSYHRRPGIRLHRRVELGLPRHVHRIPVADPISVLVDLATFLPDEEMEDAVNEADRRDLVATPQLRATLDSIASRPGVGRLRRLLDAQTFSRSQTALERRFLALVRAAHLSLPTAQERLGRYRVDFFWPELGLVVEADSLRHHRTAAEQATDISRDQDHVRAGLRTLRFTHSQIFHRPAYVQAVLADAIGHFRPPRQQGRSPR